MRRKTHQGGERLITYSMAADLLSKKMTNQCVRGESDPFETVLETVALPLGFGRRNLVAPG